MTQKQADLLRSALDLATYPATIGSVIDAKIEQLETIAMPYSKHLEVSMCKSSYDYFNGMIAELRALKAELEG